MEIGFIGAGKVGRGLGIYFSNNGHYVSGYFSRSLKSAEEAANLLNTTVFEDIDQLLASCDMIFITTPDDQIIKVWNELEHYNIKNKIICHASGALSSEIFDTAEQRGAYAYSLHPMFAFWDINGNISGLENACFTIEGSNTYLPEIKSFITSMGNKALVIDTDKKALYHAANIMAANLVIALLSISYSCLQQSGISPDDSPQALLPLITENINNISKNGLINSLTGPIERGDSLTIQKHLEMIPKQYGAVYAELSKELLSLAQQKHPNRDYSVIYNQLNEYLKKRSL